MALTRYEGSENQGGVCQLRILKRCDFEINQVIIERYRGKTGFIKISANDTLENVFPINYFTHFVAEHKQPSNRTQHGLAFEQGFTFALSKDRPDILAQITQLQDEPLVVIFKNNNKDWKVIGTEEDWAMIEVAQETGTHPSDTNQYFFDVKCPSRYLSPFLEFEKREIIVPEPPPEPQECFDGGEGLSGLPSSRPRELRKSYGFSDKYTRIGTYRLTYQVSFNTKIFIRKNVDMSIMHVFDVQTGTGQRDFQTGGIPFTVVVELIGPFPNYFNISSPCLPEV